MEKQPTGTTYTSVPPQNPPPYSDKKESKGNTALWITVIVCVTLIIIIIIEACVAVHYYNKLYAEQEATSQTVAALNVQLNGKNRSNKYYGTNTGGANRNSKTGATTRAGDTPTGFMDVATSIQALNARVDDVETSIGDIPSPDDVIELLDRVDVLETSSASTIGRVGTLETTSATTVTRVGTLETDNTQNKANITALEGSVDDANIKIDDLETKVDNLVLNVQPEIDALIDMIDAVDNKQDFGIINAEIVNVREVTAP